MHIPQFRSAWGLFNTATALQCNVRMQRETYGTVSLLLSIEERNKNMNSLKQEIIEAGRWIMAKNLTWGTSGNISASDGEHVYITASGTVMGNLREEDIIRCDLEGRILEGDKKPSKETQMHLEVYRKCPEVRAVVHTSPFYSTFCACMKLPVKTNLFIESMYYGENMQRIPYFHAGSRELAEAVKAVCDKAHVILMEHHGVLVYDTKLSECRSGLEVTENICRMNILASSGNLPLEEVAPETVKDFLEGGYFKARRK